MPVQGCSVFANVTSTYKRAQPNSQINPVIPLRVYIQACHLLVSALGSSTQMPIEFSWLDWFRQMHLKAYTESARIRSLAASVSCPASAEFPR